MATATAEKTKTDQPPAQQQGSVPAKTDGKAPHPIVAFKTFMEARMSELAYALPSHISPDRFTRVALTALQRKPDLLKCTKQSLWNACLLAAHDGLLPDGREGAIAPYGESEGGKRVAEIATWMPMVEGLRKKARNSGEISDWMVRTVRALDKFHVVFGDEEKIVHEPYIGGDDPGAIVAAYSIARLADGTISREVMTIRDIEKIKAKSKAKNGPWSDPTFYGEMCKKTVARRHYKQLPHSSDLDEFIKRDDEAFGLEDRSDAQIEQRQNRRIASTAAAMDQFASGGDGPVIEHDPEPTGTQDEAPAGEDFGEFDDGNKPAQEAKPASEQAATKADEPKAEPKAETKAEAKAEPQAAAAADKKPTTGDEYIEYVTTKVAGMTKDFTFTIEVSGEPTPVKGGQAIAEWFKSKPERDLRTAANVSKEQFDKCKVIASARINELNKAGK